ncbi:PREDICTED: uncharacterized protein LOC109479670 [Branchiostoma belcheri]|uniref:Uncharacterized protein LOC109479670 n=1 Tax=Branchiostoma belcheri TaxID=7741 RepID=A0A6P5A200_BRABE|nr:PREDICTED: uncharacterized protein LOC109479670 [Branchiostoma belcheri]
MGNLQSQAGKRHGDSSSDNNSKFDEILSRFAHEDRNNHRTTRPRNGRARSSGSIQFGMSRSEEDVREKTKEKSHSFSGLKDSLRRSFRVPSRDEQERRPKAKPKDRSQVVMGSWAGGEDSGRKKRSNSRDSSGSHRQASRTCSPNGRRDGHPDRTRVRRAKSDVGSRRNLRVTKLSTQQTLSHKNLRNRDISKQLKAKSKAREIEAYEYFEDDDGAAKRYRQQSSDDEIGQWIQDRDSTSFTSAENSQVYLEEEDDIDVPQSPRHGNLRRPGECVTGLDDIKERTKTISRLRKSFKLRRSKSDVNVSYRGKEIGESVSPNDDQKSSPYKKHRPSERRSPQEVQQDFREPIVEDEMDALPRSPVTDHVKSRRKRQRGDLQMSSNLRRSMSDVDVSYRGNRKGRTSPRPRPTRRPVPRDNNPEDRKCGDRADAAKKDDQRKQHSQEHENSRRHYNVVATPSNLRRSMSDVDVSYHATDRETSPTHHKRLMYNAPPVEFAEDSSEEKTHGDNPVILGSFKAGEDTGRKGRDGRKPAEPVGAGAKIVTGLVDSVKQSLGIHEEDVIEGETTYREQLPDLIQGWATRQYTDSKKNDDTGLINNLKQTFLESTGMHQPRGRKGGTSESPWFLGTCAGGEDSGRNHTDEPGPFSFLGGLRRSFRTSSGEDHPYGGEDEPVSPASVFSGTTVGGEDTGRNRKSGTSRYEDGKNNSQDRSRTRRFQVYPDCQGKKKHRVIRLSTQQQFCVRSRGGCDRQRHAECPNYADAYHPEECEMLDDSEEGDSCTGEMSNMEDESMDDVRIKRSNWLEEEDSGSEGSEQSLIYESDDSGGYERDVEKSSRCLLPGKHKSSDRRRSHSDFGISYDENEIRPPIVFPRIRRSTSNEYWSNVRFSDMCTSYTSVDDMYVMDTDPKRRCIAPRNDKRACERLCTKKASAREECKDKKSSLKREKRNKKGIRTCNSKKKILYNAPPMEYVVDSSDEKLSDENLVILGSFKAGEDNTSRRRGSQPIGAGAEMFSDFVGGCKKILRIPEEETVEDRGTYGDHIPGIVYNMVAGGEAEKNRREDENSSGFLASLKRRFNSWTTGGESEKRRPAFMGSWEGGEDTGSQRDAGNSGFINSLKQSLWGNSWAREQPGRDGDQRVPPVGSWAGGEDTGKDRNHVTGDSGPLGFLSSRVKSFWMPSDKDGRAGRVGWADGWTGGEDTGRDQQEGKGPPSVLDKLPSFKISPPPEDKCTRKSDDGENGLSWFSPRTWWSAIRDLFGMASEDESEPRWAVPGYQKQRCRRRSGDKNMDPNSLSPMCWWSGNKNYDRRRGSGDSSTSSGSEFSLPDLGLFSSVPGRKKTERQRRKADRRGALGPFQGIWS